MKEILAVRHYFKSKPFQCTIESGDLDNFFTLSTSEISTSDLNSLNLITKGDPITFASLRGNEMDIKGGVIVTAKDSSRIIVAPDKDLFSGKDRREAEIHPSALSGYVKRGPLCKYEDIYIKDMSYCGYRFYSNADLEVGNNVEIGLFFKQNIYSSEVTVMRKISSFGNNEYGVKVVFRTKESIFAAQDQFNDIMKNERELFNECLLSVGAR